MYGTDPEMGSSEEEFFNADSFSETTVRLGFIRKAYAILLGQIITTNLMVALFLYVEPIQEYSEANPWLFVVVRLVTFAIVIILAFCPDVRRSYPTNLIVLVIFTFLEGFMLGTVASHYEKIEVLIGMGMVAVVILSLAIFAFQTKWDITMFGSMPFVAIIILICFGFLCLIFQSNYRRLVYASFGALAFAGFLVFDTQLMMGGKHRYSLSPEEYIFGALNHYLDIIHIFHYILIVIGLARE